MRYFLLVFITFFVVTPCKASLQDTLESTCKIIIKRPWPDNEPYKGSVKPQYKKSGGSGVVFYSDKNYLWILTAGHVLRNQPTCKVYFYVNGREQPPLTGVKYKCLLSSIDIPLDDIRDLAIITIHKSLIDFKMPRAIPIAHEDEPIPSVFLSVGCAYLSPPSAFLGSIEKEGNHLIRYYPEPEGGRSGSAIFNKEGTKIHGIVIWKDGGLNKNLGTAINVKGMQEHRIFDFRFAR